MLASPISSQHDMLSILPCFSG